MKCTIKQWNEKNTQFTITSNRHECICRIFNYKSEVNDGDFTISNDYTQNERAKERETEKTRAHATAKQERKKKIKSTTIRVKKALEKSFFSFWIYKYLLLHSDSPKTNTCLAINRILRLLQYRSHLSLSLSHSIPFTRSDVIWAQKWSFCVSGKKHVI